MCWDVLSSGEALYVRAAVRKGRSVLGGSSSGGGFLIRRLCEGTSEEQRKGGFEGWHFLREQVLRLWVFGL